MASTIPVRFSPQALSRPNNTRNPPSKPLPPKKLPSKPNRNNRRRNLPPTSLSTVYGGEATTYTRLPPKHDFAIPSLDSPSFSLSVVKLSESEVAAPNNVDREKDQSSSTLGFEYREFELFEVNSDNEDEDYDEGENEDYIDYRGEMYESSSNLRSANGKFEQFEMNSDSEQEEEDYGCHTPPRINPPMSLIRYRDATITNK